MHFQTGESQHGERTLNRLVANAVGAVQSSTSNYHFGTLRPKHTVGVDFLVRDLPDGWSDQDCQHLWTAAVRLARDRHGVTHFLVVEQQRILPREMRIA